MTVAPVTMLCTKLNSLNLLELCLPNARYQKNNKKIEISVDDKVEWSYKWTDTFTPPLNKDLLLPPSSTVKITLSGKHRLRRHVLGSYSGRIVDLLDKETPLRLEDSRRVACAIINIRLSPVVDYQQAWSASVDASLARLDDKPRLTEGLDDVDQVISSVQALNSALQTLGQYIAPLGQALRLMAKLIDNVTEVGVFIFEFKSLSDRTQPFPLLKVGWTLLSSVYTAVQQQRLDDGDVRGLAESLRELVGVASDCPVAEIEGTPDVISGIARLALEVASLIDEYTRSCFMMRLGKAQVTDIRERIKQCQVKLKDLYKPLGMRIIVYTAKGAKEMKEQKLWDQIQKWLKPHDSSTNHNSARNVCAKGTGAWLAKDEQFQKWLNEPGRTLWISGRREYSPACAVRTVLRFIHEAGFGKTVLL
ncbi:hypothetical protein PAXINDRAFT_13908 [Paxillus involutus ATCC 200175]|uniref:Uncharacterized protein n=1 Tax=Paxillus involutus ATCC 200175 TaxID=664439 RepID=A0A0C9TCN0_PAXIN|nr:hypothetical protein PAXINDRAFT_13908 [Paxillus involutus ATCC 200175]